MIFIVVFTPTSALMRASSILSSISSSIFDLPLMALDILSNIEVLVLSNPLLNTSLSFLDRKLKSAIPSILFWD